MPSFQPIEPFWAHGKRYVSLNFKLKHKDLGSLGTAPKGLLRGLGVEGDKKGRGLGWKPANCANLVRHAIGEMNAWVEKYGGGKFTGTIGNLAAVDFG